MMQLNHYLNFNGTAEQAFNFYKTVFGGEFSYFKRMRDFPDMFQDLPEHEKDYVMHVSLPINACSTLMASDQCSNIPTPLQIGNNHYISINLDRDEAEARRLFEALSVHGHVEMPLTAMFWGALFATLTDQFGIRWMINCQLSDLPS